MTPNEYQYLTRNTWNTNEDYERRVLNAALGLAGEVGEVVELVKKSCFHAKPFLKDNLEKELGDVAYYLARMADEHGLDLESIMHKNIDKLKARYPDGFIDGGGIR